MSKGISVDDPVAVTVVGGGTTTGGPNLLFSEPLRRQELFKLAPYRFIDGRNRSSLMRVSSLNLAQTRNLRDAALIPSINLILSESSRRQETLVKVTPTLQQSRQISEITKGELSFTTPGTYTWIAPFTGFITIECYGPGGPGGAASVGGGGGGSGGVYARTTNFPITAGFSYKIVVGAIGEAGSYFCLTSVGTPTNVSQGCYAQKGVSGAPGGANSQGAGGVSVTTSSIGNIVIPGGTGGGGGGIGVTNGGGGGGGAGRGGSGANGTSAGAAGSGGPGGDLGFGFGTGGTAGTGGTGATTLAPAGSSTQPGGGGGGASGINAANPGAAGKVILSWAY